MSTCNPVTRQWGGHREFRDAVVQAYITDDMRDGDLLDLSGGKIPAVMLAGSDVSIEQALAMSGKWRRLGPNHVTWN